jgi:hypothetical protein
MLPRAAVCRLRERRWASRPWIRPPPAKLLSGLRPPPAGASAGDADRKLEHWLSGLGRHLGAGFVIAALEDMTESPPDPRDGGQLVQRRTPACWYPRALRQGIGEGLTTVMARAVLIILQWFSPSPAGPSRT